MSHCCICQERINDLAHMDIDGYKYCEKHWDAMFKKRGER